MTPAEKEKCQAEAQVFSTRGDYAGALKALAPWRERFPGDFFVDYQFAKYLGDWADELPPARKARAKKESIAILKRLKSRMRGQPADTRWRLTLNYYYQSEDFAGMYAFGQRWSRVNARQAAYTKGLAASYLAEAQRSAAWGRRGARAWNDYGLARETYYFAHYSMAKALAYAGEFAAARSRLETAAAHGKRPITDWEFADVLKLLPKVKTSSSVSVSVSVSVSKRRA